MVLGPQNSLVPKQLSYLIANSRIDVERCILDHLSQIVVLLERKKPVIQFQGNPHCKHQVSCSSYHVFVLHKGDLLLVVILLFVPLAEPDSLTSQSDTS